MFDSQNSAARKTLHTIHPYVANANYTALLLQPIKVQPANAVFNYRDVAIVEPVNDFVVVEGTSDGVTWTALEPAYNASADASWLSTYNANGKGTYNQLKSHAVDLLTKFDAGDSVLFRFRLSANASVNASGWAIDYVAIQQEPTSAEYASAKSNASAFPNPTAGDATVNYSVTEASNVSIEVTNVAGSRITLINKGRLTAGTYNELLKTSGLNTGMYLITIHKGKEKNCSG